MTSVTRSVSPDSAEPAGEAAVPASTRAVTALLGRARQGDRAATDELMTLVYDDLRRLADHYLSHERPGQTLQPTALVHEAYLRLAGSGQDWQNRAHFLAAAARAIRRILVDRARTRHSERRGGGRDRLPIEAAEEIAVGERTLDFSTLDEALERLAQLDPAKARVVELRFFAGLGVDETAEVLGTSASTVERDWRFARAWLHRELSGSGSAP